MYCVVQNCKSDYNPSTGVRFHTFPKDDSRRNAWLSQIKLKGNFYPSARICSLHFKPDDYHNAKCLRSTAVPTFEPSSRNGVSTLAEPCNTLAPSTNSTELRIEFEFVNTDTKATETLAEPCSSLAPTNGAELQIKSEFVNTDIKATEMNESYLYHLLTTPTAQNILSREAPRPGPSQLSTKVEHTDHGPAAKRVQDFQVQVKKKSEREIKLEKINRILKQKVLRQQKKIQDMRLLHQVEHTHHGPAAKRQDFQVQVKKKTEREIELKKINRMLKQKVVRQQKKIQDMETLIVVVPNCDKCQSEI